MHLGIHFLLIDKSIFVVDISLTIPTILDGVSGSLGFETPILTQYFTTLINMVECLFIWF